MNSPSNSGRDRHAHEPEDGVVERLEFQLVSLPVGPDNAGLRLQTVLALLHLGLVEKSAAAQHQKRNLIAAHNRA
jgi:hypothetical protein